MAVAGISPEGKSRGGGQPGIWLTPPPSPGPHHHHLALGGGLCHTAIGATGGAPQYRVRSSYHTPTPRLLHDSHHTGTSSLSASHNNLTREPVAQRHSTGDLAMARDPSAAFYKSLTRPRTPTRVHTRSKGSPMKSDDVKGSAESLVVQVRAKRTFTARSALLYIANTAVRLKNIPLLAAAFCLKKLHSFHSFVVIIHHIFLLSMLALVWFSTIWCVFKILVRLKRKENVLLCYTSLHKFY